MGFKFAAKDGLIAVTVARTAYALPISHLEMNRMQSQASCIRRKRITLEQLSAVDPLDSLADEMTCVLASRRAQNPCPRSISTTRPGHGYSRRSARHLSTISRVRKMHCWLKLPMRLLKQYALPVFSSWEAVLQGKPGIYCERVQTSVAMHVMNRLMSAAKCYSTPPNAWSMSTPGLTWMCSSATTCMTSSRYLMAKAHAWCCFLVARWVTLMSTKP